MEPSGLAGAGSGPAFAPPRRKHSYDIAFQRFPQNLASKQSAGNPPPPVLALAPGTGGRRRRCSILPGRPAAHPLRSRDPWETVMIDQARLDRSASRWSATSPPPMPARMTSIGHKARPLARARRRRPDHARRAGRKDRLRRTLCPRMAELPGRRRLCRLRRRERHLHSSGRACRIPGRPRQPGLRRAGLRRGCRPSGTARRR